MTAPNGRGETAGLTPPSAEITGLVSAMNHVAALTKIYDTYATASDLFVASLAGGEVSGAAVTAAQRAREAEQRAAAAWAACHQALTQQLTVKDAYTAAPGAGSKQFVTGDTDNGTGAPAPHSDDVRTAMTTSPHTPPPGAAATDVDGAPLPDAAGLTDSSSEHWHGSDVVTAEAGDGKVSVGLYQQPDTNAYVVVATSPIAKPWEPESDAAGIDPSLNQQEAGRFADALDDLVALAESGTPAAAPTQLEKVAARVRGLLGDSGVTIIGDQGEIEVSAADIRTLLDAAAPEPAVATRHKVDARACLQDGMDTGAVWAELDTSGPEPVIAVTSTEGEAPEDYPEGYTTTRLTPAEAADLAAKVRRFAQTDPATDGPGPEQPAVAPVPAEPASAAPEGPRRVTSPAGRTYEYDPDTGATAVIEADGWRAVVPASSTTGAAARLLDWNAEIKAGRGADATDAAARALLDGMSTAELREVAEAIGSSAGSARTKPQLVAAIVNTAVASARKHRALSQG